MKCRKEHFLKTLFALCLAIWLGIPSSLSARTEDEDVMADISLADLLNMEVSVATKTEMTMEQAPSVISVITGEEIRNMGARDITDVLKTVPGFDFLYYIGADWSEITVRGISAGIHNNKVKFLMNGHALHVGNDGIFHLITEIPVDNITRIEIIRGPGSALYGTGAFIGVVSIITKQGGEEPSEISLTQGTYDSVKPYGEVSYEKDDFKAYLYGEYYATDGYDGTIESDFATNSPYLSSAAPGKMSGDGSHLTAQTYITYKNLYLSGFFSKSDRNNSVGIASVLTDEDEVNALYAYGEIGCNLPIRDKGNLLLRTYYDFFDWDAKWEIFPEETAEMDIHTGFPQNEGLYGNPLMKYSVFGGEITTDYEIYSGIQVVTGTMCEYVRQYDVRHVANFNPTGASLKADGETYDAFPYKYFSGGMTDISENGNWLKEADRTVTAIYGQGVFDLKELLSLEKGVKSLSFTAGIRYDKYDDIGSATNPRFGLVYSPTESLYFKVLYGKAFRAPAFIDMYALNNPGAVGNEDLSSEKIRNAEFLMGYHFTNNIRGSITCYDLRLDDLIQIDTAARLYKNIGSMKSRGVEAELKAVFDKDKYAYCNLTWQDVKNTTNMTVASDGGQVYTQADFDPGSIPDIIANIGVNYGISEHVIANVSLNYIGERKRSEEKKWDGEKLTKGDLREPSEDCTLVNDSLTFRNFYKSMEIQLSGFNLFDADYRIPDPEASLVNDMPRPGRTFTGRISYSF